MTESLQETLEEIALCRVCEAHLPLGPRPVVRFSSSFRILVVGQAPGTKVHESGVPWNDASGVRLRDWLGVSPETFYNTDCFGVMGMGFCYPGRGSSGDLPPRPECAPLWHPRLLPHNPRIRLTVLVGSYALDYYLKDAGASLAQTVKNYKSFLPRYFPVVHPSPRNQLWLKRNPWFLEEVVPDLKERVRAILAD